MMLALPEVNTVDVVGCVKLLVSQVWLTPTWSNIVEHPLSVLHHEAYDTACSQGGFTWHKLLGKGPHPAVRDLMWCFRSCEWSGSTAVFHKVDAAVFTL